MRRGGRNETIGLAGVWPCTSNPASQHLHNSRLSDLLSSANSSPQYRKMIVWEILAISARHLLIQYCQLAGSPVSRLRLGIRKRSPSSDPTIKFPNYRTVLQTTPLTQVFWIPRVYLHNQLLDFHSALPSINRLLPHSSFIRHGGHKDHRGLGVPV